MKRDTTTESVWQEVIPLINNTSQENASGAYDVIIIGAGITGLTTGLLLQEIGKKCLILEARSIGFGTSSGTTAHLNTVLDTPYATIIRKFGIDNARLIAGAAKESITVIKGLVDKYDIICDFEYRPGYLFASNTQEEQVLSDIHEALGQVNIDSEFTDKIPVPIAFSKAIRFAGQAQFHPTHYLLALVEAFLEKGGTIMENARADNWTQSDGIVQVSCGSSRYECYDLVHATHIPSGLNLLHFTCAPYRSYVLGIELEEEQSYPEALVYDLQDPYHYFRTVYLDNKKLLLAGGNDHKTGHNPNTDNTFLELEAYARKWFAIRSIPYKWSAQYYEPADGLPYIGLLPGHKKQVYVATGYSGNGMIFGTLAGRLLSDLITKGSSRYASLLAPSRITPVAGFKNFIKENIDVAKHFIADRFGLETLSQFSELSKEEGKIVVYREEQIAIYKDEYGVLKALHPVCPHAGCIVQWNSVEKSWDCPCHGARYDVDGALLNGPATTSLRKVDLE